MALKVLVAEDDESIQMILKLGLVNVGGMELVLVNNGAEALEALKSFRPDVILTDIHMPIMEGPELMDQLSKQDGYKNIPVIFFSAEISSERKRELLKLGAQGIISKPFNPMGLAKLILDLLEKPNREQSHGP